MSTATARALIDRPWAIRPESLASVVSALEAAHGPEPDDTAEPGGDEAPHASVRGATRAGGSVVVLPVSGVITPRPSLLGMLFGIDSSLQSLRRALREAVADEQVAAIVLDVDSPGGLVDGVPETAAEIRQARDAKPVVAVADTQAASAAYWLASQASELWVTPSGEVGSIGVFAAHQDLSGRLEQLGVDVTLISAGRYKTEGNPYEPLSEEAREAIQAEVDGFYDMFVADVATGRDVARDAVRSGFGEGRMVMARAATREGMADRVGTVEEAVQRAARLASGRGGRRRAHTPADPQVTDLDLSKAWARDLVRGRVPAATHDDDDLPDLEATSTEEQAP